MPELHLCIATGQNAANFIPLKQLGAQEICILETPDMAALHSGANLKTALAPYAGQVKRLDFDDVIPGFEQTAVIVHHTLRSVEVPYKRPAR